jgi:hypothetical protein
MACEYVDACDVDLVINPEAQRECETESGDDTILKLSG